MSQHLSHFIALLFPIFLFSQQPENQKCGFEHVIRQQESITPGFRAEVENYIQNILPQLAQGSSSRDLPVVFNIPVVVHVIHSGESIGSGKNISNDRIFSQIDILNNDFRRMNADASQTPFNFQSVAADTEIEFCLAQTNPQGNTATGITRHQYGSIPSINYIETVVKPNTTWNPDEYLNIWTIDMPNNDLLGYSFLPTQSMVGSNSDGVVINYTHFGYINPTNRGRTTVHEVGHYLGLLHIWGSDDANGNPIGCNSDDNINDTPNASAPYFGCPFQGASCGSPDMYMNYMDYTDDNCMNLFTQGQKNVMRSVLAGIRSNLAENGDNLCPGSCYDISSNSLNMGFESSQSFDGWVVENANNDNTTWQFFQQSGNDWGPNNGEGMAIYFWNQDGTTPADDYLFTPCFQVKKDHAYSLTFTYACAMAGTLVYPERLEVGFSENQSSNDFFTLGSNWVMDPINNPYPDYNTKTFTFISNSNGSISIGFHVISDADQYAMQIDDVKIEDLGSTISNNDVETNGAIAVFPNPTTGKFTLQIALDIPEKLLDIAVYDVLGRLIENRQLEQVSNEQISFDLSSREPGMYLIYIKGENLRYTHKVLLTR